MRRSSTSSTSRLPGGGPKDSCHSAEAAVEDVVDEAPKMTTATRHRNTKRIVYDQQDPITTLEQCFNYPDSKNSPSTETIFIEHRSTQTATKSDVEKSNDDGDDGGQIQRDSFSMLAKDKNNKKNDPYYYHGEKRKGSMLNTRSLVNKIIFWKRFLTEDKGRRLPQTKKEEDVDVKTELQAKQRDSNTLRSVVRISTSAVSKEQATQYDMTGTSQDKATQYEEIRDSSTRQSKSSLRGSASKQSVEPCANCQLVPEMAKQLYQLQNHVESQVARVHQLNEAMKMLEVLVIGQKTKEWIDTLPDKRGELLAKKAGSSCSTSADRSATKTKSTTNLSQQCANKLLTKQNSESPSTVPISTDCPFCAKQQNIQVLQDLILEVVKLIGSRSFDEIRLTLLLRADNVYHVHVQERKSQVRLGCLLASHAAVQEANKLGFFKDINTYYIINGRSTLASSSNQTFCNPPQPTSTSKDRCSATSIKDRSPTASMDAKTCQFVTKVLNVPRNRLPLGSKDETSDNDANDYIDDEDDDDDDLPCVRNENRKSILIKR